MSAPKKAKSKIDHNAAVQALEYLFAAQYIDKKKLYFENFLRGVFFSVGSVLGAAVVVTLLLWVLSLFEHVPFIADIVESARRTLERS